MPTAYGLTAGAINGVASSGSYKRAQSITKTVYDISQHGNSFEATVSGSDDYDVSATVESGDVTDYSCSCPDNRGGACKHVCALLICLLPGQSTSPKRGTSPIKTVSPIVQQAQLKSVPVQINNTYIPQTNPSNTIKTELTQLISQYQQSGDSAFLAKVACAIYKYAKEAVSNAKYNPVNSLSIVQSLVAVCVDYASLFTDKNQTTLTTCAETVARACSAVLVHGRGVSNSSGLARDLQRGQHSFDVSVRCYWNDAIETAGRVSKEGQNVYQSNNSLISDSYV